MRPANPLVVSSVDSEVAPVAHPVTPVAPVVPVVTSTIAMVRDVPFPVASPSPIPRTSATLWVKWLDRDDTASKGDSAPGLKASAVAKRGKGNSTVSDGQRNRSETTKKLPGCRAPAVAYPHPIGAVRHVDSDSDLDDDVTIVRSLTSSVLLAPPQMRIPPRAGRRRPPPFKRVRWDSCSAGAARWRHKSEHRAVRHSPGRFCAVGPKTPATCKGLSPVLGVPGSTQPAKPTAPSIKGVILDCSSSSSIYQSSFRYFANIIPNHHFCASEHLLAFIVNSVDGPTFGPNWLR